VARPQAQDAGQPAIARSLGTIKTISGNVMTLTPDSGPEVMVTVEPNARLLKLASGDKDLKNATPLQVTDLQVGDKVRVRGYASADGKSINGLEVIVITRAAVQAVSEQMRQDWQKRGVGGIVDSVDPVKGDVTLSVPGLTGKKTIVVHTTKGTSVHRYAPDSAKAEDAKTISLQGIQVGDQLRARGNRSADGSEVTAEEIFTGVFPRWVGTIKAIDASAGTLTVQDLATKKTVQVKVTADSQLHKIPAEMAQRFAVRLKAAMPAGMPGGGGGSGASASAPPASGQAFGGVVPASGTAGSGGMPGGGMGGRSGGAPDFQQIVSRLPSSTLTDLQLQKGDAVVILATEGSASSAPTAITLLSGVEPILQAAPNGSQAMMLAPWSLGGAPGGDAAMQ
jgi:co-chaperonin GroES (HSP10)